MVSKREEEGKKEHLLNKRVGETTKKGDAVRLWHFGPFGMKLAC